MVFLALVMSATARHIRAFGALNQPAYAVLWMVGVGQDYRLFNWIDRVAFDVRTDVRVTRPDGSAGELPAGALPDHFRAQLLRGYAHGIRWLLIPQGRGFDLRLSLGYSWGGPMSLVVPYELRTMRARPTPHLRPGTVVRFSVGLENPQDLQADLAQALAAAFTD